MNRVLRHRLRNLASGMRNAVALLGTELDARLTPSEREYFPLLRQECDELRRITKAAGALLIFDEVISGFRVARGGAQELYGVTPDLTCLGKIIGGGLPVGAVGGRAELLAARWGAEPWPVEASLAKALNALRN